MAMIRPDHSYSGSDLCGLSALEAVDLLRSGEISPSELLDASEERVRQTNGSVNSMVTECFDRARDRIKSLFADRRNNNSGAPGWLAGLPIGIKDLSAVSGVKLTMGTPAYAEQIAEKNDPIVDILESHGGIVVGKTNTPEMGAGGNTFNSVFGYTRNPWDTRKNAGGSSGGAAASLACGQTWLSQGSDLAGSLRTPGAYCGVVGFRPSPGRAFGGPLPLGFSPEGLSGPMARSVSDCALFLDAMAGYDNRAPLGLPVPEVSFLHQVEQFSSKVKIAFSPTLGGFAPVEDEIETIMRDAMDAMGEDGATIVEDCPDLTGLYDTYITLRALFWASLPGRLPDHVQAQFKDTLRDNIAVGRKLTVEQIIDANLNRTALYHSVREFLGDFDVLACAVVGVEQTDVEVEFPTEVAGKPVSDYVDWLRFSFLATAAGLPAISVPCGFTDSGMPVGIQLIGPPRGDAKVLCAARAIERCLDLGTGPIDPNVRH